MNAPPTFSAPAILAEQLAALHHAVQCGYHSGGYEAAAKRAAALAAALAAMGGLCEAAREDAVAIVATAVKMTTEAIEAHRVRSGDGAPGVELLRRDAEWLEKLREYVAEL